MRTHNASYGELRYLVTDESAFAPYAEYLRNFAFMLALILEGRRQQNEIRRHQSTLEARVNERTAELALSQERLALATDSGEIGVWDFDPVNNHLVWDATMYRLYGVSPEAFSGAYEAWQRTVHPQDIERAGREVAAALADGSPLQTEFRIVCPNGDIRHIQARARTLNLDASEKNNLEIINRSGNHLLTLINDVLDLSKIDAGRVELLETEFNLPLLLNDVIAMLRPRAEQAGLTLSLEIQSLPVGIRADAVKLRQILINLLGNAIKFTQTGGVTLNVAGTPAAVGRVLLEIAVSDTGIGIAEADLQKVFEPFTQIVTHATAAGTGLGLSITRRYLTMLGGELSVTSTPGQGSTFRFSLNVPSADVGAASAAVHGMVSGLATADRGKSILVVEDNPEARILLKALLEPLGFAVSEAHDGAAAVATVAQVGQAVPDFILMDWRMPNMDGLEATRRIRALPLERQPKIVMLTATAFAEQRQEALDAGAHDYLRKPVNEEELYATLETQLGIRFERTSQKIGTAWPAPTFTPMVVTPEALTGLPEKLRADLRQAVEELDTAKLKIVLPRIAATHPQLAHDIAGLAAAFRYQELWILLSTPVERRRP